MTAPDPDLDALRARRDVLEREIAERQAELFDVVRRINRASIDVATRRRAWERQLAATPKRNTCHPALPVGDRDQDERTTA